MVNLRKTFYCGICGVDYRTFKEADECESKGQIDLNIPNGTVFLEKNSNSQDAISRSFKISVIESKFGFREHSTEDKIYSSHWPLFNAIAFSILTYEGAREPRIRIFRQKELLSPYNLEELPVEDYELAKKLIIPCISRLHSNKPEDFRISRGRQYQLYSPVHELKNRLEHAVLREKYEDAAKIRDSLNKLYDIPLPLEKNEKGLLKYCYPHPQPPKLL